MSRKESPQGGDSLGATVPRPSRTSGILPDRPVEAALAYRLAGWSVIPVQAEGKRALVRWRQWQQAAPGPEQIERWWRRWPGANVAVVTGRVTGVVVVDIDPRHGGDHALAELEGEHGDLPYQSVVETLSGGRHLYFAHPGGRVGDSNGRIGAGVDVRGDGGLALLPPSRRTAGAYRWAIGGPTTVPAMPPAWVELVRPPKRTTTATRTVSPGWFEPGGHRDAARLAGLLRVLQRAPEGQRNGTLYWAGCRLAEMGAPDSWVEVLSRAGEQAGLDRAEIRTRWAAHSVGTEP